MISFALCVFMTIALKSHNDERQDSLGLGWNERGSQISRVELV
jgi:hypothetical protein